MDAKTLEALKGSIEKWEKIVTGKGIDLGSANCPLCMIFLEDRCAGCPVAEKNGTDSCEKSPYISWYEHGNWEHEQNRHIEPGCSECTRLAQAELDFLKSLLPEETK